MHPQAIPPFPTSLEPFAASLPEQNRRDAQQYRFREAQVAQQCSFPIRTTRNTARNAPLGQTSLYPYQPEYNLRRKTPSGTIDAGYDGSPPQLSPSSRPSKHMILTENVGSDSYSFRSPRALPLRQVATSAGSPLTQRYDAHDNVNWTPRRGLASSEFPAHPSHTQSFMSRQAPQINQFHALYQPVIPTNEHNVRAFCPPSFSVNESLSFGQNKWNAAPLPWGHGNLEHGLLQQPKRLSGGVFAANEQFQLEHMSHLDLDNSVGRGISLSIRPNPYLGAESSTSSFLDGSVRRNGLSSTLYPQFKEKALLQAHRSYVDLLAYLQTTRKLHHGKPGSTTHPSSKLFVYPKPPRPTVKEHGHFEANACSTPGLVTYQPVANNHSHHGRDEISVNGQVSWYSPARQSKSSHYGYDSDFSRIERSQSFVHIGSEQPVTTVPGSAPSSAQASVLDTARASLQLIHHLSEQSGWKWIDGLLLAGCLQYGLERYDEALESFYRVLALDSSHIEALTNAAATLYCLNRQTEAEQRWLEAIKMRPDCLEAAEHLVGLLYKKRSKEAVEVINHVQQALRLNGMFPALIEADSFNISASRTSNTGLGRTINDYSHPELPNQGNDPVIGPKVSRVRAHGFGSSGYALPGSENGRILALVHAKGTMLYSLKEVVRASEAFEEAVLISVGRCVKGVQELVHRIQAVLSPSLPQATSPPSQSLLPLLLPPEKARLTSQLVFPDTGELPGLRYVPEGGAKRAAVQTTSNSLLSLAKIFQDGVSSGVSDPKRLRQPSGVGDILALYYLSLSLQESPSTANNVGILLAGIQHITAGHSLRLEEMAPPVNIPGIPPGSGLALALAYYHYGLRLDPKHVHLHTNLGSLLKDIGQLDLAIQMYERAVSCDGTFDIALTNLANAVKDRGRVNDAIGYYRRAVNSNPNFAEAVCGLLTALNSVCDWRGRGGVILASGKYDRWHVDEDGMLVDACTQRDGSGLTKRAVDIVRQQLAEAAQWGQHTLQEDAIHILVDDLQRLCGLSPLSLEALIRKWSGEKWEGTRLLRLVERAVRVSMRKSYLDRYVSHVADGPLYLRPRLPPNLTVPSAPTVLPFHTFTTPLGARDIRVISQRNALRISCSTLRSSWLPARIYPSPPPPEPRLNVGYISSDFNNHPLAHLMQSVFGFHDTNRVHAVCYATTPSDKSSHRTKIEQEAPVFRDVSSWLPDKVVNQIVQDQIHILVNLNGYTRGARNEIFAARPAPIQMSFMGFAGTMGAEWCDYILADTTAIPPSTLRPWRSNVTIEDIFEDNTEDEQGEWVYSENIIFCRDTFFCCDHAQSSDSGERGMTWSDEEQRRWRMRKELFPLMSDDTIILGNFNQLYKIEPTTFRTWLRILTRVPKAVLWLLRFPETGETNLRRTAEAWAGSEVASRIVFTDVAPKSQHISRARICDLFLDTPECNAHTTAADVLWSSTPLLTLPRYPYKMCSRMAASILQGALPKTTEGQQAASELIAADETEYERKAIRLALGLTYTAVTDGYSTGSGRLADLRRLLWASKWTCGLFDTRRWVSDVEAAYSEAWKRFVAGQGGDIYL